MTFVSDPKNFRASWWHARGYGWLVANPFGHTAMQQGPASRIELPRGEPFHRRFAALLHSSEPPPNLAEVCSHRTFQLPQ